MITESISRAFHHEGYADLARRAGPAIVSHLRDAGIRQGLDAITEGRSVPMNYRAPNGRVPARMRELP
jgi:hypothetical protein